MTTRNCDASGKGEAHYKLSGYVWFIYVHSVRTIPLFKLLAANEFLYLETT